MKVKTKLNLRLITAALLTVVGCGLLISGFIVPPIGVIDSSVLVAFGESLTFVGTVLGIDYRYRLHQHLNETANKQKNDNVK